MHHAVFRMLYPIFDKAFIYHSYSCRNEKGTHRAVNRLQKFARKTSENNTKTCFILKCDIRRFFGSIDRSILIGLIQKKIKDKNTMCLMTEIIKSFSTSPNKGLPLGNITSQLFANIYLNELDQFIKHILKIKYYIRYCDDFVILNSSKDYLDNLIRVINYFLQEKLRLSFHPDKIKIRKYRQGIDFLGYVSFPYYRILRTKTKRRVFRKIKQKINDLKENKITKKFFEQTIQSYFGLLKHCNSFNLRRELSRIIK